MADEAVVRIVLQDAGTPGAAPVAPQPAPLPPVTSLSATIDPKTATPAELDAWDRGYEERRRKREEARREQERAEEEAIAAANKAEEEMLPAVTDLSATIDPKTATPAELDAWDRGYEERRRKRQEARENEQRAEKARLDAEAAEDAEPAEIPLATAAPTTEPAEIPFATAAPTPKLRPAGPSDPIEDQIAYLESINPQTGSPAARKLEELRKEQTELLKKRNEGEKEATEVDKRYIEAVRRTIAHQGGLFGRAITAGLDIQDLARGRTDDGEVMSATQKIGAFSRVADIATAAFREVVHQVDRAAKRYGEVSPEVAQAQAIAEFRGVMNDIRRGQEHGEDLARLVDAKSRMDERFEDAKMRLLMKFAPIIEGIFDTLGHLSALIEYLPTAIAVAISLRSGNPLAMMAAATLEIASLIRKATDKDEKDITDFIYEGGANDPGEVEVEV